jgi:hypothetical protein
LRQRGWVFLVAPIEQIGRDSRNESRPRLFGNSAESRLWPGSSGGEDVRPFPDGTHRAKEIVLLSPPSSQRSPALDRAHLSSISPATAMHHGRIRPIYLSPASSDAP